MTRAGLEESVTALPARALHNTGKIYLWGRYIFINELYEGLHIIDNQDPSHPQAVAFLRIPGNVDMAVRDHLLYVDNGPDLVTLDLRDVRAPRVTSRVRDAFRELPPPQFGYAATACVTDRPANTVVVGWQYVNYLPPASSTPTWGWQDRMLASTTPPPPLLQPRLAPQARAARWPGLRCWARRCIPLITRACAYLT